MSDELITRAKAALAAWHHSPLTSLVRELVTEVERLRKVTDIIDPESVHREQRDAAYAERDQWKALWQENTRQAAAALAERDKSNAEVETLRAAIETIRSLALNPLQIVDGARRIAPVVIPRDMLAVIERIEKP